MSFSKLIREENEEIFNEIYHHPFVQGLGKGELKPESVAHYVKADFEYLNAFMHVYGLAVSKTSNRDDIEFFNEQIQFILNSEIHPHLNLCEYIGIPYEELQGYSLPPTADHYIKHMMFHASNGSLGQTIAALLPCPWTYLEIGRKLLEEYQPDPSHPFYSWIKFYSEKDIVKVTEFLNQRLDEEAERATEEERNKMREAFRKSCQLEWAFWEMSLTCEEWPFGKEVHSL